MKSPKFISIRKKLLNQKTVANIINNRKEIKTPDYHLTFRANHKTLEIHDFLSNGRLTREKAIDIRNKLIKHAKENNLDLIATRSWIFYEYPKYAEIFGFKLVKGSSRQYDILKKLNNVKKVIGADINSYKLYVQDKEGKIKSIKFRKKHSLPRYEIDLTGKIKYE